MCCSFPRCSYVLVINTPRLCHIPGFSTRLSEPPAGITCREIVADGTVPKPEIEGETVSPFFTVVLFKLTSMIFMNLSAFFLPIENIVRSHPPPFMGKNLLRLPFQTTYTDPPKARFSQAEPHPGLPACCPNYTRERGEDGDAQENAGQAHTWVFRNS